MKNKKIATVKEFMEYASPIIKTKEFRQLKNYIHHAKHTVYRHAISVAYISYKMALNKKNIDMQSLIKVALLHDYYLYDWHKLDHKRPHGFTHPYTAMQNADRDFGLTKIEKKAIRSHMWPLTLFHIPTSRIGWIICTADKISARYEYKIDKMLKKAQKLKEKLLKRNGFKNE